MRLSEAQVGDLVLASSAKHPTPAYAKITALPHSKSAGDFVRITMEAYSTDQGMKHETVVTPHHTFPACSTRGGVMTAKDIKPGDCLHTVDGKRTVAHVAYRAVAPWDKTYSVVLEGKFDRIAVGGILTHANPPAHSAAKADNNLRERRDNKEAKKREVGGASRFPKSQKHKGNNFDASRVQLMMDKVADANAAARLHEEAFKAVRHAADPRSAAAAK
jgi:hypothetical protein